MDISSPRCLSPEQEQTATQKVLGDDYSIYSDEEIEEATKMDGDALPWRRREENQGLPVRAIVKDLVLNDNRYSRAPACMLTQLT